MTTAQQQELTNLPAQLGLRVASYACADAEDPATAPKYVLLFVGWDSAKSFSVPIVVQEAGD